MGHTCVALEISLNILKHFHHSMICLLDNLKNKGNSLKSSNAMLLKFICIFVIKFLANSSSRPKYKTRHYIPRHYSMTDLYCKRKLLHLMFNFKVNYSKLLTVQIIKILLQ